MFDAILGNEPVKVVLKKMTLQKQLPHALLFAGPDGVGKSLFAKDLAIHLLQEDARVKAESHPDFHVLRPEGKSGFHTIESLKTLISEMQSCPFEAPAQLFLIHDAHRMQPAAANALLKTLEEPTPNATFILLTCAPQEILPTVASRCSLVRFQPLSEYEISSLLKIKGLSENVAKRAHGSVGKAFELAAKSSKEEALLKLFAERPNYPELMLALQKIEKEIEDEDPVNMSRKAEELFACVLMWHRDLVVKRLNSETGAQVNVSLFFPEGPSSNFFHGSLFEVERAVDEARAAFSRNIRLSLCLEKIFSACKLLN